VLFRHDAVAVSERKGWRGALRQAMRKRALRGMSGLPIQPDDVSAGKWK
jgi:hypothetical protein